MSFTQLEYFVAVAEEGTLSRAAARLHVSQPPLTRQIKGLEEELGAPLFSRSRQGMQLLPSGLTFLRHARRVLAEVNAARDAVTHSVLAPAQLAPARSAEPSTEQAPRAEPTSDLPPATS